MLSRAQERSDPNKTWLAGLNLSPTQPNLFPFFALKFSPTWELKTGQMDMSSATIFFPTLKQDSVKPQTSFVSCSIQNPLNNGINKNIRMPQLFARCPKCGTATKAKRSTRWRMCAEGDCDSCGVHFTTAAFWQSM